jgi:hypothetical protein
MFLPLKRPTPNTLYSLDPRLRGDDINFRDDINLKDDVTRGDDEDFSKEVSHAY